MYRTFACFGTLTAFLFVTQSTASRHRGQCSESGSAGRIQRQPEWDAKLPRPALERGQPAALRH